MEAGIGNSRIRIIFQKISVSLLRWNSKGIEKPLPHKRISKVDYVLDRLLKDFVGEAIEKYRLAIEFGQALKRKGLELVRE
jgi:hypothetical protein